MRATLYQPTLTRNTDGRKDIVACYHYSSNVGLKKFLQNSSRAWLELVLENNEANKVKVALSIGTSHLLSLDPTKLLQMPGRTSNYSISFVSVVRE